MELKLPENSPLIDKKFTFGISTSSFQIEGGSHSNGRCPSIWDTFCGIPGNIKDGSNGTVACDHFNRWQEDVELISSLNVDAYRLSLAWPRIISDRKGTVNKDGLEFYRRLIDALKGKGIKPFVTLYHWDLPQYLEDRGGWLNRETAYAFAYYADIVSGYFGDDIKVYSTLNEPWVSAFLGYMMGIHAPGLKNRKMTYQAAHHLLLAHGLAMPNLRRNAPNARHGIVLNFTPAYPETKSYADTMAAELADAKNGDWFLQPLLEGKYPQIITKIFSKDMPLILSNDMEIISEPLDYLGINYYSRLVVSDDGTQSDLLYKTVEQTDAEKTEMGWEIYPDGLHYLLKSLNEKYQIPAVYITENGMACADEIKNGEVDDPQRVKYIQTHLNAIHQAVMEGINVEGYFAWSLMDNFEWAEGYTKRFGLVYVDYQTQERILKKSAIAFRDMLKNRKSV